MLTRPLAPPHRRLSNPCQAGQTLGDITSVKDLYSPGMIGVMLGLAVIALVPVAWTYFNNCDARRGAKLRRD